jgi:hypothetical protein
MVQEYIYELNVTLKLVGLPNRIVLSGSFTYIEICLQYLQQAKNAWSTVATIQLDE